MLYLRIAILDARFWMRKVHWGSINTSRGTPYPGTGYMVPGYPGTGSLGGSSKAYQSAYSGDPGYRVRV
eukprot:2005978-Rhodomonas_salina.1